MAERAALPGKGKWFAVGALVVAGGAFAFIALGGLSENLVYYWGPTELRQAGDKAIGATIRLGGQVVEGSVDYDPGATSLAFEVTDKKEKVAVKSHGVPPQMFREKIGVIVEGTLTREGHFESSRLMVSHGNEYRAPKGDEKVDAKKLMETAEGMSGDKPR
jgi:cytochrome c-type biogenesis protein CcmE